MTPEVRVGLLTIVAAFALVFLSLKTAGTSLFGGGEQMTFYLNFNSVAGVEQKSKIRLSGVEIGYVKGVELKDNYARVVAVLTHPAQIRTNALGTIRTEGLLGEKYIEIVQGTQDAPLLGNGDVLERTQEPADISDMLNKLGIALDDVSSVTGSFKNVFGSMEGQKALKRILSNIDSATGKLDAIVKENRAALKTTIGNFSKISTSFAKNAPRLSDNLDKVASGLREIIEANKTNMTASIGNIRELTENFNLILKENRENLKTTMTNIAEASSKIDGVMRSVKSMTGSFEKVATKIESGEGTVGRLISDDEVYNNLNSTLKGAKTFLNKAEDVRLSVGFRNEYQFNSEQNKAYTSLKIEPREDKYYLIELSEDLRRNNLSTTRNTINSLLYTLLFAKRFSDVTLRAGIMESSAGVGAEVHLLDDDVTLSTDIFNLSGYDSHAGSPQVKAMLRWNFYSYLYLYAGADELLNEYYRTYLFGGGIMFGEDDLKMALGLL